MKVYLDNCCYNRPFDDQNQDRIRIESEAILIILKWAQLNKIKIIGSEVIHFEIDKMPDIFRREEVRELLPHLKEVVMLDNGIVKRAKEIGEMGFKTYDALHIACAESCNSDYFITTDDGILKKYEKHKIKLLTKCENPLIWVNERLRK